MKWIARVLFYAVSIGLLVYAATRSLDFIQSTMPADQKLVGYLGLLATSGGSIAWLAVFLFYAQGTPQKGLSMLMTIIDLLGEFALMSFDTLYRSGESGMTAALSADEVRMVIIGLSILIALNIGATFAFHLIDPETSKRMREESARDTLDDEVLKEIERRAPQLASQMVPNIVAQWEDDFSTRFANMSALGLGSIPADPKMPIIPAEGYDEKDKPRKYQQTSFIPVPITRPVSKPTATTGAEEGQQATPPSPFQGGSE
jgi:hypothetical protein